MTVLRLSAPDLPQSLLGGPGGATTPVPRRFVVTELTVSGRVVRLVDTAGRTLTATPGQLTVWSRLLSARVNPDFDAQFEAEFLDRPARPADDVDDPAMVTPLDDPVFGPIVVHPPSTFGTSAEIADVRPFAPGAPWVDTPAELEFDSVSRARLGQLLPAVHRIVAEAGTVWERAVGFLWNQGSDEDRAGADRAAFATAFQLMGIVVYHSGDFGVDLHDTTKDYIEDGYWPHIGFRADLTPVEFSLMA